MSQTFFAVLSYLLAVSFIFPAQIDNAYPHSASSRKNYTSAVQGQITGDDGLPVAGAVVRIEKLQAQATTDTKGQFSIQNLSLPGDTLPVTVTVLSNHFANWSIQSVRLYAGDTLLLTPLLTSRAVRIQMPSGSINPAAVKENEPASSPIFWKGLRLRPVDLLPTSAISDPGEIPTSVRVRITGDWPCIPNPITYTVQTVDFKTYVKHVLPSEWDAYGRLYPESLRAGAVAI